MHLSPLGFAACQSKKCTNQARSAPILNPPTDFTDLHRSLLLRRNSHRIHRFHRSLLLRRDSHRIHRFHRSLLLRRNSHRIHRIHRSLLLKRNSHRIHRIHRSLLLRRDSHRFHRIHRSLLLRRNSHRFHGFTQMQANCSVNSVNSVGVFTLYKYLCGSVQSVGEYPLPVCSVCSVKSVGASLRLRGRSLLLRRNSHRIHRIHRSLLLRRDSHRFHGFTQMQANCSVNSVNSVGVFTLYKYLCGSVQSVGEYPLPVCSVCSAFYVKIQMF